VQSFEADSTTLEWPTGDWLLSQEFYVFSTEFVWHHLANVHAADCVDGFDAQSVEEASQYRAWHRHQRAKTNPPCLAATVRREHAVSGLSTKMVGASAANHPTTPSDVVESDREPIKDWAMKDDNGT
jgi:hypothetical protein